MQGEHPPLVLPDVRQPAGDAPDRALQRPARHRGGEVSEAHAEDGPRGDRAGRRDDADGRRGRARATRATKAQVATAINQAKDGAHPIERSRLEVAGLGDDVLDRLLGADWVEVPGYTAKPDRESARDRSTRRNAVEAATDSDLLVLLIDDRAGTLAADATFASEWDHWYTG